MDLLINVMRLFLILVIYRSVLASDLGYESVGITNGIIDDSKIIITPSALSKSSIRLGKPFDNNCPKISDVTFDMGRIMTIKGMTLKSPAAIDKKITLEYGTKPELMMPVLISAVDGYGNLNEERTYSYMNGGREQFINVTDWITARFLKIKVPNVCLQVELHACSELCSSYISYPSLKETSSITTDTKIDCSTLGFGGKISLDHAITLTGIKVFYESAVNGNLELECRNNNRTIATINKASQTAKKEVMFWFEQQYICDEIFMNSTCSDVYLAGCNAGSMSKLGLGDTKIVTLSAGANGWNRLPPQHGFLHHCVKDGSSTYCGWIGSVVKKGSVQNGDNWLKACFTNTVLVQGMALQGSFNNYFIIRYNIHYKYNTTNELLYKENEKEKMFLSPLKRNLYRYLVYTDRFREPFMTKCIRILSKESVAVGNGDQTTGLRWEILGSSSGNYPAPKINDKDNGLECVSLFVKNYNSVSWKNNNQLIKDTHYTLEETHDYKIDGYRRLSLTFLQTRRELYMKLGTFGDDTERKTLFYSIKFACAAVFDGEEVLREHNSIYDYEEKPNLVLNAKLTGFNNSFATFSWSANLTGLYLTTLTYNITIRSSKTNFHQLNDIKTTYITVDGLSPLTKYDLLIQAKNKYDTYSDVVTYNFETPGSGRPEKVSIDKVEKFSVQLSWKEPKQTTGNVTQYQVECKRNNLERAVAFTKDAALQVVIGNMSPNTIYLCRVRALVNKEKVYGRYSDWIDVTTKTGDLCEQPIHQIGNIAVIADDSKRLNSKINCSDIDQILRIDLGRIMSITGFAIQGPYSVKNIKLSYSSETSKILQPVYNGTKNVPRTYDYNVGNGYVERFWFKEDPITLSSIEFMFGSKVCVKVELFGCSEACSSALAPAATVVPAASNQWCFKNELKMVFKPTSLNGLFINANQIFQETSFEVICSTDERNETAKMKRAEGNSAMLWFNKQFVCRSLKVLAIQGSGTCANISFAGCLSGCMKKLGVGVEHHSNKVIVTTSTNNGGSSFLNNMAESWKTSNGDKTPWIKACFPKLYLVTSVAVQGNPTGDYTPIQDYTLAYSYGSFNKSYTRNQQIVKFNGPVTRYGTTINSLPVPVTATCIQLSPIDNNKGLRWELLGCEKGLQPKIGQFNTHSFPKSKNGVLSCLVTGQPGTTIKWKINNDISLESNKMHYVSTIISRKTDLEYSFTSTLTIFSNITNFIITKNNAVGCKLVDQTKATCILEYHCIAYYDSNYPAQESQNVSVTDFDARVASPIINDLTRKTNISLSFSWSNNSAENGDFPITGYIVTLKWKDTAPYVYHKTLKSTETDLKVDGLDPYVTYTLFVKAFNKFNVTSKQTKKDFTTDEGVPSQVANITQTSSTSSSISLTWSAPDQPNGKLSDYFIEYGNVSSTIFLTKTVSNNAVEITNLKPFMNYKVRVRASTKQNSLLGPWSNLFNMETAEAPPSKPLEFQIISMNASISNASFWDVDLSWKEPAEKNGIIKNYKIVLIGAKDYFTNFKDTRSLNSTTTSVRIEGLYAGSLYKFQVSAVTGGGKGVSSEVKKHLEVSVPFLASISSSEKNMEGQVVQVNPIEEYTGKILHYNFAIGTTKCFEDPFFTANITFDENNKKYETINIPKGVEKIHMSENRTFTLDLFGQYKLCSRAVVFRQKTNEYLTGQSAEIEIVREDLEAQKTKAKTTKTTTEIKIPKGPAATKAYIVVVNPSKDSKKIINPSGLKVYDENNEVDAYITGIFEQYVDSFVVGDGNSFDNPLFKRQKRSLDAIEKVRNAPLTPGKDYSILVNAFVDEEKYYSSPWLLVSTPTTAKPVDSGEDEDSPTGTIAAVVVIVILVIVAAGAGLFIYRRRQQHNLSKDKAVSLQPLREVHNGEDQSSIIREESKGETLESESNYENIKVIENPPPSAIEIDPDHAPIEVMEFPACWLELSKNDNEGLKEEYNTLRSGQIYEWTEAVLPERRSKNRYANIVAYNHSRVKLKSKNSSNSDYVNASHIHGYRKPNQYIASQGPNISSLNDFWQMIWEQEVSVIVISTNLIEKNKKKCEQYWPDNGSTAYGIIEVTVESVDNFSDFVIRTFSIKKINSKEIRTIQQYHYLSWPDHGVPQYPSDILSFRHKIRKDHPFEITHSPVLVHCSAGVGRTGTFICIDNILQLAAEEGIVDIFNFVNYMRTRRIHMVQTDEQYVFIYQALYEAFTCGITEIDVSQFGKENQKLLRPNQNGTNKNGYQLQFERLNAVTTYLSEEETSAGNLEFNKSKNRNDIFPSSISRVMLTSASGEEGADYINAVYVNGYKIKDAFIATQHPLPSTAAAFWQMVFEKKVSTIAMLNALYEEDQAYEMFWPPAGQTMNFDKIKVFLVTEENDSIKDTRKLTVAKGKDTRTVTLFNYTKWPENDMPASASDIIQLLALVETEQGTNESPIVVMCSDGAGRSGTFIAISILMEQLKLEHTVDIFQTIKKIRAARPEFVLNHKQYQFCYKIMQYYIDSFSTYSNFTD